MDIWVIAFGVGALITLVTMIILQHAFVLNFSSVAFVVCITGMSVVLTTGQIQQYRMERFIIGETAEVHTVTAVGLPADLPAPWPAALPMRRSVMAGPAKGAAAPAAARNPYLPRPSS